MLGKHNAIANIAVKKLDVARKFYEGTLGLKLVDTEGDDALVFVSGNSKIFVYHSQYAGTNKATAMTWEVGNDVESLVQTLRSKGVTFEHYDMPGLTRTGDVYAGGDMKIAWFKDPDGNILSLVGVQ